MNLHDLAQSRTFRVSNGAIRESEGRLATIAQAGLDEIESRPLVTLTPGTVVDSKYKVLELLGTGGMGAVYKVLHLHLDKEVALKTFLTDELTEDSWMRFQREARSIAKLSDINIVKVFDFGIGEGNLPYYTMEVLEGESLAERLKRSGPLPLQETLACFQAVARALLHAHKLQIVHRDIKPGNIFITEPAKVSGTAKIANENIKLVDFGIAKLATSQSLDAQRQTDSGLIFGSPLYMSPEQSHGQSVDERSDVYSFGCALFEALTGSPPFIGSNVFTTTVMHHTKMPPTLAEVNAQGSFSRRLEAMIAKMLAKSPEVRYQNFAAVLAELEIILQDLAKTDNRQSDKSSNSFTNAPRAIPEEQAETGGNSDYLDKLGALKVAAALLILAAAGSAGFFFWSHTEAHKKTTSTAKSASSEHITQIPVSLVPNIASSPLVRPTTPYSRMLPDGSREFNFDYGDELGVISIVKYGQPVSGNGKAQNASGRFRVPPGYQAKLKAGPLLAEHPELFDRFRPDDFYSLLLDPIANWSQPHFAHIAKLTELHELSVNGSPVDAQFFQSISSLKHLDFLDIAESPTTADAILQFKGLDGLALFNCSMTKNVGPVIQKLKAHPHVADLAMEDCDLTDKDFQDIAAIHTLNVLRLGQNRKMTIKGLGALSQIPHLKTLMLEGIQFSPDCARAFKQYKELDYLRMNLAGWTPEQIENLRKCMLRGAHLEESGHVQPAQRWTI